MPISLNYLLKRIFLSFLVILGVIVFSYTLLFLTPGDPAVKWAGNPRGPGAALAIELARRELGLDQPLHVQIAKFVYNVLTGNIGLSIAYKVPVTQVIASAFTSTLELLIITYLFGVPVGVALGTYSALRRGGRTDSIIQTLAVVLASTPTFWLALIIMIILQAVFDTVPYGRIDSRLAMAMNFKPITGFYLLDSLAQRNYTVFIDVFTRMIPPALAISIYPIGVMTRVTRTLVAEALLEDNVRAAVAWGVKRSTVLRHYVLKSTIPPVVQISGLSFTYSLVDAMVVESMVFGREGLGSVLLDSLHKADFRVSLALIIYLTVFYIVVNTLVDILQAIIDPRVRL